MSSTRGATRLSVRGLRSSATVSAATHTTNSSVPSARKGNSSGATRAPVETRHQLPPINEPADAGAEVETHSRRLAPGGLWMRDPRRGNAMMLTTGHLAGKVPRVRLPTP
jgi:hypothetical protein